MFIKQRFFSSNIKKGCHPFAKDGIPSKRMPSFSKGCHPFDQLVELLFEVEEHGGG